MAKAIDANAIPSAGNVAKEVKKEKVELKNVLFDGGQEDMTVEVMPFNRYDDEHTEFAYSYSDMLSRMPSDFKSLSEASRAYVRTFMVRTKEEENSTTSKFNKVLGDLRACRTLFLQEKTMQALNDFFGNA